jgi:putative ABC transport system permease protein
MIPAFATALFRLLLGVCPREMRDEYGALMRADFAAAVRERGLPAALLGYGDVLGTGLSERAATLGRDLSFALRGMRRAPMFAIVVIATTAVAIGANGGIFGSIGKIVLRPLPFHDPASLVVLWEVDRVRGYTREGFTYLDFDTLRRANHTLADVAALVPVGGTLVAAGAPPQIVRGTVVSGGFFRTYAARPVIGRLLDDRDERDGTRGVVISAELWRNRFGRDPKIVGRTIRIDDAAVNVVGVAPAHLIFVDLWRGQTDHADYFVPLHASVYRRGGHALFVVGRPAGTGLAAVTADVQRTLAGLAATHPQTDANLSARALWATDAILGPMWPSVIAISLAVLAVLVVACANVGNLFLSRASARTGEMATRFALGATRRRLIAQLLTETTLYVALGGVAGIALAAAIVHVLASTIDAASPVLWVAHLDVDWTTFAATGAAIVLAAVLAGVAPALALSRPDLAGAMKSGDRAIGAGGAAVRSALVTLEIALAITIVATAAIATRSYAQVANKSLGFASHDVSVVTVAGTSGRRYDTAARAGAFEDAVRSRVDATPGVRSTAWATTTPFLGESSAEFEVEGARYAPGSEPQADVDVVSDAYLGTLGIPLLTGRDFARTDGPASAPVAIVSRAFAARYLGGVGTAIGKRITVRISTAGVPVLARTVIGVAGDVRPHVVNEPSPTIYAPIAQLPYISYVKLVVRSPLSADAVAAAVRAAIKPVDETVPPVTATSLEREQRYDALDRQLTDDMLGGLAVVALVLAIAGVYAVLSYGVARRTREIGIRVAFGASPRGIAVLVMRDALRLASVGIAIGLVLASVSAWALKGFLDVDAPVDGVTAGTVLVIVALAIGFASYLPARHAARLDPVVALRYE